MFRTDFRRTSSQIGKFADDFYQIYGPKIIKFKPRYFNFSVDFDRNNLRRRFWTRSFQKEFNIPMNWNWTDFYPEWTDPFQIRSSFLEKDLDPIKIQEKWSEFRIWNCCVQFLTMYGIHSIVWKSTQDSIEKYVTKDSKDLNSYQKFIALIEIVNKILLWDMWQKIQFDIEIWKQD